MLSKPAPREADHRLKGARLLEQVAGSRHHFEALLAPERIVSLSVEREHVVIEAADDQEGWGTHLDQSGAREIGRPPRDTTAAM